MYKSYFKYIFIIIIFSVIVGFSYLIFVPINGDVRLVEIKDIEYKSLANSIRSEGHGYCLKLNSAYSDVSSKKNYYMARFGVVFENDSILDADELLFDIDYSKIDKSLSDKIVGVYYPAFVQSASKLKKTYITAAVIMDGSSLSKSDAQNMAKMIPLNAKFSGMPIKKIDICKYN